MNLLYPGYKAYFDRLRTKPFHTEYSTRYCNSEGPVLYSQVPKYSWCEPRRPTAAVRRYDSEVGTRLTYLRPPFAARMASYITDQQTEMYHEQEKASVDMDDKDFGHSRPLVRNESGPRLPDDFSKIAPPLVCGIRREIGSPRENLTDDQVLQMLGISSAQSIHRESASARRVQFKYPSSASFSSKANRPVVSKSPSSRLVSSFCGAQPQKLPNVLQTASGLKDDMVSQLSQGDEQTLRRVAPRPSSLLSKHAKHVRYVRDTCFFHPTQETRKHYYIVNPNWFSEQRVTVPKNNVFS